MAPWAKTGQDGDYLPLVEHLRDVSAVAQQLWDLALTQRQQKWYAVGLGVSTQAARALVSFVAGAHDVGKATQQFQMLAPDLAERLVDEALLGSGRAAEKTRHDAVSGAILAGFLEGRGLERRVAVHLAATVSGHHGVPRRKADIERARRRVLQKSPAWRPYHEAILAGLADELGCEMSRLGARVLRHEALIAVAGLVSFADWIASDAFRFPVTAGPRAPSRLLAEKAVDPSAWSVPPAPPPATFVELFERPPRATQTAVGSKVDELEPGEPSLVLVEDRTGAGKTEAAFLVAQSALRGGARGLYVGMPTRATARQLHERTARFLDSLWTETQVAVRLLHGGAVAEEDEPVPSEVERDDQDPAATTAEAQQWFAQSRRGLLAPFAVGTIDQVLLAVLNARHYQVRVWGLQGKVVILDEVHAYDAYTGLLLERLVEWLAALDCTVVLLSATLPPQRRAALLHAFAGPGIGSAVARGYPRVSVANRGRVTTSVVEDDRPGRAVLLRWRPGADDPHAVATLVLDQVRDGGCVALVCSTVADAQTRWAAIRARDADLDCLLLHARLRPVEREQIERRLLDALGPPGDGAGARPERLVVVATQVIEQSLDLDFDVMLSDLAPIDLLIQRAGRVHRHARRSRPSAHAEPRLTILDGRGDDPLRPPPASAGAVYVRSILVRTRLVLGGRPAVREPDDLDELIATTYEAAPTSFALEADQAQALRVADDEAANERRRCEEFAQHAALVAPTDERPPWEAAERPLDDPEAPGATGRNSAATRWSEEPSVDVVLLAPFEFHPERFDPDRSVARALLQRAVSVTDRRVTGPLLDQPTLWQPTAWRRNSRLRRHFLIELDDNGLALPAAGHAWLSVSWDPERGVAIGGERHG